MSGSSRVSISESLRRTIKDIKEIAGQHSDEDVYAILKECNMDPNETAQKLLNIDTFHEVKKKRDRRKASFTSRANEEYGRRPGMQRQVIRDGGESYYPSYNSDGFGGGRQIYTHQEYVNTKPMGRAFGASNHVLHKAENKAAPAVASSAALSNGVASSSNGSSSRSLNSQFSKQNIGGSVKKPEADENNTTRNLPSLPAVMVKQLQTSNHAPIPTPTPKVSNNSSMIAETGDEIGNLKANTNQLGNIVGSPSVSGLYSSASDPVLVPSLNPRNPGAVGIIKREAGNHRNASEISANPMADTSMNAVQHGINRQSISGSVDLTSSPQQLEYEGIETTQMVKFAQLPPSTNHYNDAAKVDKEACKVRHSNGLIKDVMPETAAAAALDSNMLTLPAAEDPSLAQATSEVDTNLEKLNITERQSVIFPNHLHVPEAFKKALTFGSLDSPVGQEKVDSNSRDDPCLTSVEAVEDPSLVHQPTSSTSGKQGYPQQSQSSQHLPINFIESHENVQSGSAVRYDQSKQEILQPVGVSQNSFLPPMPDSGPSFVSPVVGSYPVQVGLEPQVGNALVPSPTGLVPPIAQPTGITQNSIAVSPQLFPYLRQPYPPTYVPYNPYYSQFYMPPQYAQQLISPNAFPQQPSAGNMYMPPAAAAASAVKFPIPQMDKQGSLSGNFTHLISSGYGSYGASSGLGYNSNVPLQPGSLANNDDIAGSELKEKNIYSMMKQNEDLHLLASASGRETPTVPTNIFHNIVPQAQPVAYSPAQAGSSSLPGIYHPTQSLSAASFVQSLQQSHQPVGGTVDSIVPPLTSYPQQYIPMPQPQHMQMTWNQELINRENM